MYCCSNFINRGWRYFSNTLYILIVCQGCFTLAKNYAYSGPSLQAVQSMYKLLFRPLFFLFDPEKIHHFTFSFLKLFGTIPFFKKIVSVFYSVDNPTLERELFGLKFKNPIGLAAGFDKDAKLIDEL